MRDAGMKIKPHFNKIYPFILISWRNLWRQKRRSLVVISSIAIGIFAMILSMSFSNGMMDQMVDNTIGTSLGDIAIHRSGFQDNMKLEYNFLPGQTISFLLDNNRSVKAYAPRVKVKGMIRSSEAARGVMIMGVDPAREKKVSTIYHYTIKKEGGRYLADPSADEIIISKTLAEKLDLYIGDKAVVMFQDKNNEIQGVGLQIVGFFETPMGRFDKSVVFMGIKKLQEITGLGQAISEMTVIVSDENIVDVVKQYLIAGIRDSGLEILSWKDMAPNLVSTIQLINTAMLIFFMIIFITVIFSIANTLIMSIIERFHELGVMKSIGTRPSYVFFMVIFEAINLGLVGLVAGIAVGVPLVLFLGYHGIDMSFALESVRQWGTGNVIYPAIKLIDIIMASEVVLITTVIAAVYPAYKAARIKPLDALNYL
jgi:ABC-type lipoprotein release transport system permease subunit